VRVIELRDEGAALEAYVVVDHDLFGMSAGGTRMLADVDVGEVARLARAMTWKFASARVPYAGAKAGVRLAPGSDRAAVLAAYKRALEPHLDAFQTGPDMGTAPADFVVEGEPLPHWAREHEGLGMDDLATGHGVKAAAEAALAHLGRPLAGAAVAIEGFGKVGAGAARAFARAGARVVGVSTVAGLVADPDGLDVEALIALRERHGDDLVQHAAAPALPREELFDVACDVLVPGARPDSITAELAGRLSCAVVAPGANVPYAPGALDALHARGILAVPDFIANAGGVHLYVTVADDDAPEQALAKVEGAVRDATVRTLAAADEHALTPFAAALRDGREHLARTTGAAPEVLDALFSVPPAAAVAPRP
jgi:glutamate dehydrogenase (NAD(P)+)